MCNCRQDLEGKLLERFQAAAPEAKGHGVELKGYGFSLDESIQVVAFMEYETGATYPLKKGGEKYKTQRGNMIFSHCPFCGESFSKATASTTDAGVVG